MVVAIGALVLAACGSSETSSDDAGGNPGTGGTTAEGGHTGTGTGGASSTGGATGTGGSITTGGVSGTGGATGTGGVTGTGGASANGGAGGTKGTGGIAGTGGGTGTGTGGAKGGTAGSGGMNSTGGTTGTGGSQGNAPAGASAVYPPNGGTGVCPDAQLRITFPASGSAAPSIGSSGKIQVFNSAGTAVATVDVGASSFSTTNGGMTFTTLRPVYVDGNMVVVYLPSNPLTYGQTYYVNVASGAIKSPSGANFSVSGTTAWRFTTAAAPPASKTAISVALDGSAPFCSLQGALDFIPANNTAATTVSIASGTYHEIVYFKSKSNVTIKGASQTGTIFAATNNNNLNPSTKGRAMIGADGTNGLTITNLTIDNQTPQGGSQAEALRLESCDKCVITNATIISLQDTLLWDGRLYAKNCLIEGNVDYVWGGGAAYFDDCEIRTIGRTGVIVQARNPATSYGYVFVDSKITSDAGLTGISLARIDASVYPASNVAYINCQMSSGIAPGGWTITGTTSTSMLRFWEYQSVDSSGNPINVSQRVAGSKQLTAAQATMMRDPTVVLAGWQPPGT